MQWVFKDENVETKWNEKIEVFFNVGGKRTRWKWFWIQWINHLSWKATRTHTHRLSFSIIYTHYLSLLLIYSLSLTRTQAHTHTVFLSLSISYKRTHTNNLSLSISYTRIVSLAHIVIVVFYTSHISVRHAKQIHTQKTNKKTFSNSTMKKISATNDVSKWPTFHGPYKHP